MRYELCLIEKQDKRLTTNKRLDCVTICNYISNLSTFKYDTVRNRLTTELVMLKVHNIKLSFDI